MIAIAAAAILVLIQNFLIFQYSGRWIFPVVATLVTLLGMFVRLKISFVVHVIVVSSALVGTYMLNLTFPVELENEWTFPARYLIPLCQSLVIAQIIELFKSTGEKVSTRFVGICLAGFLACFCRMEDLGNEFMFFVVAIAVAVLILVDGNTFGGWTKTTVESRKRSRIVLRIGVFAFAILTIITGTNLGAQGARVALGVVRFFATDRVVSLTGNDQQRIGYSISGDLRSVTKLQQNNPDTPAILVTSEVAPGYLRGRVFEEFNRLGWKSRNRNPNRELKRIQPPNGYGFKTEYDDRYRLYQFVGNNLPARINQNTVKGVTVSNSTRHIGAVYFTPLRATAFEGQISGIIRVDSNSVLRMGYDRVEDYVSYVPRQQPSQRLSSQLERQLLEVPDWFASKIENLALEICSEKSTDQQRIRAIENHFRINHQYSLEAAMTSDSDPITEFILQRRGAHCEYFATAAALCLRLNGIPARYVTGFGVSFQSEEEDDEWIGRNRDAHAWVEAYDRDRKTWVVVEATPGVNLPKTLWPQNGADDGDQFDNATRLADNGQLTDGLSTWDKIQFFLRDFVDQYGARINVTVAFLAFIVFALVLIRARSALVSPPTYSLKSESGDIRRLDRRLKKLKLKRQANETLHQFATRLQEYRGEESDWVNESASDYLKYAEIRYARSA